MKKPVKVVSAPGRICLFGEHSDYIGLPVITMAMNLRLTISAFPRRDKKFQILMPDIQQEEVFVPSLPLRYKKERDYLRAAVNVLKRQGFKFPKGYDFLMKSKIPINSGASSSSAMVVAWIKMLLSLQNHEIEFNPIEIAKLAFETEVLEFKEAGGRMDHFAISMGELIYLENHKTTDLCFLGDVIQGIVLGDSLQRKETVQNLKVNKRDVLSGLKAIKAKIKKFDVEKTKVSEILNTFPPKTDSLRLRESLKISTPKIERMIEAALSAGALGAKIHGSGLGGTMIAYAPGREKQVTKAIEREGGKPTLVHQDRGIIKHL
ncbi:MAG: GHMP kinase [Deltaproteobacteria bacterium]|nr:GHMP kinase [Deltaproteobacteria bacterium]